MANFMPKLFAKQNGNGMHIHMSLFDEKLQKNAFYDEKNSYKLSTIARSFIAGNLNRMEEIELLLNSSVNSFKRLVKGYEAPIYLCWGKKNRSAALRIPDVSQETLETSQGAAMRVEFRIPDASCNPYLAFAALIEAGIKGIELNERAPEPIEQNLYHVDEDFLNRMEIKSIPSCLGECIDAYRESAFAQELLGESLFTKLLEIKQREWMSYTKSETHSVYEITAWEKEYHGL